MTEPRRRRLRLLDLMILIFAIALGIAPLPLLMKSMNLAQYGAAKTLVGRVRSYAAPPLAALTIASLGIAMCPPRPPFRRLVRRPGFMACATAITCLIVVGPIETAGSLNLLLRGAFSPGFNVWDTHLAFLAGSLTYPVGLMVAGAWLCMALNRRWRTGDWVDRLGQLIGVGWIVEAVAGWWNYL
jgi:hypothetical protein